MPVVDKTVSQLAAIDAVMGTDLVLVVDDPAGTPISKKGTVNQVLASAAKTNVSNTFVGDQTIDGDLFVTGTITPSRLRAQRPKIDALEGRVVGDPAGNRTLMSQSLVSGLSVRHDETIEQGKIAVGNYDAQVYQPLLFDVQSLRVETGLSPATLEEHVRVHPSGGVTVGTATDHVDPGTGVVEALSLGATPLNADNLATGTIPAARMAPRLGTIGLVVDGAGAVITTGVKGFFEVGAACTITGVTLLSTDAAVTPGSVVIDIWKAPFATYPPTVANTITASAKPTLASATKSRDTVLTGWTKTIAAGDILAFSVLSASLVTKVSLTLTVQL